MTPEERAVATVERDRVAAAPRGGSVWQHGRRVLQGMPQKPLAIYLQDHLAGSTAGVNLARRFVRSHAGTQAGRTLAEVGGEIEADRDELLRLMAELGIEGSRVKNTAAWLTERLARLKPNGRLSAESALQGLHELESLA